MNHFEFELVSIDSGATRSLLQVDYHNPLIDTWAGCDHQTPVYIDTVLLNPTHTVFAFTIRPLLWCLENAQYSQAYIVNYENTPATVQELPNTDGLSWSPDGNHLAYYSQNCEHAECDTTINSISIDRESTPIVLIQAALYSNSELFTAWIDNVTVMYQWRPSSSSETGYTLVWQNITDNSINSTPWFPEFSPNQVYYLEDEQVNLLGVIYPGTTAIGIPAEEEFTTTTSLGRVYRIFYNSRFPQMLFMNLDEDSVDLVDASLNVSTIDLTGILPDAEGIGYVAPGTTTP